MGFYLYSQPMLFTNKVVLLNIKNFFLSQHWSLRTGSGHSWLTAVYRAVHQEHQAESKNRGHVSTDLMRVCEALWLEWVTVNVFVLGLIRFFITGHQKTPPIVNNNSLGGQVHLSCGLGLWIYFCIKALFGSIKWEFCAIKIYSFIYIYLLAIVFHICSASSILSF